jgi:hypothetical protein
MTEGVRVHESDLARPWLAVLAVERNGRRRAKGGEGGVGELTGGGCAGAVRLGRQGETCAEFGCAEGEDDVAAVRK